MMGNIRQTKEKHETNETKHRTGDMISRSAAIEGLDGHYVERATLNDWQEGWNAALDWVRENYLEELPSAEPEQKAGYWIMDCYVWRCSECGKNPTTGTGYVQGRNELFDYCPNCGAKMEVEKDG